MQDGKPQATMICGRLLAEFSNAGITNQSSVLERFLAEQNVLIQQGADQQLSADRAFYVGAAKSLLLTGNPAWKDGPRDGRGNEIVLNGDSGEMKVSGDAMLRSPGADFGEVTSPPARGQPPARAVSDSNAVAIVRSDEQVFRQDSGLVTGHVLLEHPRMTLSCDRMSLPAVTAGEATRKVVAEGVIKFDGIGENDQRLHGEGIRIDYDFGGSGPDRTETVTLHGNPARLTSTGSSIENSVIILDRARNKVFVPGRYVLRGTPATGATNAIPALRLK